MSDKNYTTGQASVTFTGLTMAQAKCFAHWYEGSAEQDTTWFEESNVPAPMTDVGARDWLTIDEENQKVIVKCHTPPEK